MRKNSKGFTLVELIVTIVLLSVVAAIIIFNVSSISKNSLEKEYEAFRQAVLSGAESYSLKEKDAFNELFSNKAYIYFTTGDVISAGYLREDLVNPRTKERIDKEEKIKALLDSTTGAIRFEYPAEPMDTEQYLVSLMDYVANGEPYDCMQGIGTYRLALADEDGSLINDPDKLINEYKLSCSYDARMQTWTDSSIFGDTTVYGDEQHNVKFSNEPNDYDITYTWVTKSGTRKTALRKLRVLETFVPDVELRIVTTEYFGNGTRPTISNEDFNNGIPYEELISGEGEDKVYKEFKPYYQDGKWTYLAFKPILVGADIRNTSVTIQKKIDNTSNHYTGVINKNTKTVYDGNDFDLAYAVDDGDITYTISTSTGGHYFSNFKLNNSANITVKQDLTIPYEFITGGNNTYTTGKTYNIADVYSPIGVKQFEFAIGSVPSGDRDAMPSAVNRFGRELNSTTFTYDAIPNTTSGDCAFNENTSENIYFRAINNDGFFGSWTRVDLYTTNNLSKIIDSNRGDDCNTSCSQNTDSLNTKSLGNISCYYCNKSKYVQYNDVLLDVLGKKGDKVIVADDTSVIGTVAGSDITANQNDVYGVQTVDGYKETSYTYTKTVPQNLFNKAALFESNNLTCNYNKVFSQSLFDTDNQGSYVGYSAVPTESDTKLFKNALDGEYWIAKSGESSTFDVTVYETMTTQKSNYYWYYHTNEDTLAIYTGGSRDLKTIHLINKGYICSGNGEHDTPYVISKGC